MSVRVFAPAKVNLTLNVGRPRADGMHPLQSIVMFADIGDWIEAEASEQNSLHVTGPFAAALEFGPENNIVWKAVSALQPRGRGGARITLEKNLPVAAGLGGGSADAAAALKALNRLWRLNLSGEDLLQLAATLGADVPVCVAARSAWMSGIGDVVTALEAPPLHVVLVNPLQALSTADVFRKFDEFGLGADFVERAAPRWRTAEDAADGARAWGNDLAAPASRIAPVIQDVVSALADDCRVMYASLSGSGATSFGIVRHEAEAASLAADIALRRPDWWVKSAKLGALDPSATQL